VIGCGDQETGCRRGSPAPARLPAARGIDRRTRAVLLVQRSLDCDRTQGRLAERLQCAGVGALAAAIANARENWPNRARLEE